MLVFRCECEHVLGVESESSNGGVGECPSCGRIIRVPQVLVNAKGRLRLMGNPSRATPSGAFRQINAKSDPARPSPLSPSANFKNDASVPGPHANGRNAKNDGALSDLRNSQGEAEVFIPEPAENEREPGALTAFGLPAQDKVEDVPEVVVPSTTVSASAKNSKKSGKPQRPLANVASNDPAAATETRIDKNIAAVANAAASSKRRKAEPVPVEKKPFPIIYVLVALVLLVGALTAFALGVFDPAEKPEPVKTPPAQTAPAPVTPPAAVTPPADKAPTDPPPATPETKAETVTPPATKAEEKAPTDTQAK